MILTNRLHVELNLEKINEDFDIYRVTKESKNLDRYNILDLPEANFSALSVQYSFGRNAFVLFRKGSVLESEFRKALQEAFQDVTVYHVTLEDLQSEEFCSDNFYYGNRLLVQLLMNSIRVPRDEELTYNNLTGKLYYTNESLKKLDRKTGEIRYLSFLEIKLDPGMFLNLNVKTFRRTGYVKEGRTYVIDPLTGNLRKHLKTDDQNVTCYTNKAQNGKHVTVDYLDISSFKKFQQSKLGVMERFLGDVKRQLGDYLVIKLHEMDGCESYTPAKKERTEITEHKLGEMLNGRGVVIVDENHTEESAEIIQRLCAELQQYYLVTADVGMLDKEKYNIRIIHTPEYYAENEMGDPHNVDLTGYIVQHMMEEEEHFSHLKSGASPAVNKIVQELIIKGDVREGQISIYDWQKLAIKKEWSFVIRKKIQKPFEEKTEHINLAGVRVYNYYEYRSLTIRMDGVLTFTSFTDEDAFALSACQQQLAQFYDESFKKYNSAGNDVEGLVYSDIENIHAIIRTAEKTMPDITALWNGLKDTDREILIDIDKLMSAMEDYALACELNEDDKKLVDELKSVLSEQKGQIRNGDLRKMMGMGKRASKRLNRYLRENHGIWIAPEIKDSDMDEEYRIGNILDISYYQGTEYDGTNSFSYFVGTKRSSMKLSFHNACAIRKVISQTGRIEYDELLPMLSVEFVRNKQYTVLPFPFKYLREWRNYNP